MDFSRFLFLFGLYLARVGAVRLGWCGVSSERACNVRGGKYSRVILWIMNSAECLITVFGVLSLRCRNMNSFC